MRLTIAVRTLVSAALLLAAGPGQTQTTRRFKIALIGKSEANAVFLAARRGAEAAAKEQSAELGFPVEVIWMTPAREDAAVQAANVAQAARDGADAVLLACSDAALLTPAIDAAVEKGVAVMTFDSDAAGSKRFAYYGADETDFGEKLVRELAAQIGGKGKIAVLAGNTSAPNLKRRAEAVQRAAAQFPGIEILEVVGHREAPAEAAAEVVRFNAAHPDLAGWVMIGGWALRRSSQSGALYDDLQRRKTKVVAVDALPEQLMFVEKGLVPVLWAQPNYLWGKVGVETILGKVYRKKPVPERIRLELVRVSRENLGSWARQLDAWGFTGVPQEYLKFP